MTELEALYDAGRYGDAHRLAVERHGPLAEWRAGVAACLFGGRLAGNLGGDRLRRVLTLRARRGVATDPEVTPEHRASALRFHAYLIIGRRGPLALRRFFRCRGVQATIAQGATAEVRADILCLEAHIAAAFHDAETVEARWQEACALAPDRPWTWAERASLLVSMDRYQDALEAVEAARRLHFWFRPAVQVGAHVLTLLGRDEEAVALLEAALDPARGSVESPAMAGQLADIVAELGRPQDALRALDRFRALDLLQEEAGRDWEASRRSEALLKLDELGASAAAAESLAPSSLFYERTVERLRDPVRQTARRLVLEVPFIRQYERTCAPATLAALTRFWDKPVPQEEITRAICYGGTFDHQERHWTETQGWVAREFRTDWPSVVALIDAGIPFALATTGTNSGHLQAVIGYDARRGTIVLRDPYLRSQSEALAEEFFANYALSGPRAMAIVPGDEDSAVERLAALDLPEAGLYDGIYHLRRALHVHDRPAAAAAAEAMAAQDPAARLTLLAARELAYYDGDEPQALELVEKLLALFPKDGRLRLEKAGIQRRLSRFAEARAWLESCASEGGNLEPNLWRELARDLAADPRSRPRARLLLTRSLFVEPTESAHLRLLAEFRRDEGDFAEAFALFRLAATSASVREDCWQDFFVTSRYLGETENALHLLTARFQRLGDQSSQPARTLHWAHRERHEYTAAAAVLGEALRRRPEDGELLLFAATVHARDGEHEAAARYLARAKGAVLPAAYARTAAELAELAGDARAALAHCRARLDRDPLDADAHRMVLRLLAETDPRGPAAAQEHLDAVLARFPHAVALHEMRIALLRDERGRGTPEHTAAVTALLEIQPTNLWAQRERALDFHARGNFAAALDALGEAERLSPQSPHTHALRGHCLLDAGDPGAAELCLRRALELDADVGGALPALLRTSADADGKRARLRFMHGELVRQPYVGDGILAYRASAYPLLAEPDLQAQLDAILAARPDLWQAWSAVVWQHADAGRLEVARARALEAAERFPLLTRVWLDLAAIEERRRDNPAEVAALERALRIQSALGDASRRLAAAHQRADRPAEARRVLEEAIAAAPRDMVNRVALAEVLWQEDRASNGSRAVEILSDAVEREPGLTAAWEHLEQYTRVLGRRDQFEATLRRLTATRPGEARSWLRLATSLSGDKGAALEERLGALDRALALNPRLENAYDLRAMFLANAGRYDEALAACAPPETAYPRGTRPFPLDGRAAWIAAQRGDLDSARAQMRRIVLAHPAYEWGWRMLADWAEEAKDYAEAVTAAERLVFLAPHTAVALGYLASAQLLAGKRPQAKEALQQAMRVDTQYFYAPSTLLKVQMEDREWAAAEQTLQFLGKHHPGAPALVRTVFLATRRRDEARAIAALADLARLDPAAAQPDDELTAAVDTMSKAGWRQIVATTLKPSLKDPEAYHPEAPALWVRTRAAQGRWWGVGRAIRRLPPGEPARRARYAYISAVGEGRLTYHLLGFLRRMREPLRADTRSWGQVGYALSRCRQHGRVIRWLADWRQREEVEPWMIFNLATALRVRARHDEAVAVNRHALTLPADNTHARHLAWVTFEDALLSTAPARAQAGSASRETPPPLPATAPEGKDVEQPYRFLNVLTRQVLAVNGPAQLTERRAAFRAAQVALRKERRALGSNYRIVNRAVYRAERRARFRMARDAASLSSQAWLVLCTPPASLLGSMLFWCVWIVALVALTTLVAVATGQLSAGG